MPDLLNGLKQFYKKKGHDVHTFYYAAAKKRKKIHSLCEEQVYQYREKNDVKEINERIGKDSAVLPDVVLVCLQEGKRQGKVERVGSAGNEYEPAFRTAYFRDVGKSVENECCKRIEREKIGGKGDKNVGLC